MLHKTLKIVVETLENEKDALSLLFELKVDGFYATISKDVNKYNITIGNIETMEDCDEIIRDLEKYYETRFNLCIEKE